MIKWNGPRASNMEEGSVIGSVLWLIIANNKKVLNVEILS